MIRHVTFEYIISWWAFVTWTWLRYVRVCHLSVVCLKRCCTLFRGLKLSAIFLNRSVPWPSSDLRAKFNGDRQRGTPPSGALNTAGVVK